LTEDTSKTASPEKTPGVLKRANAVTLALLILFGLSLFTHKIIDSDIWWHLKTGEHILETSTIPDVDMFSYTAGGNKWIDTHWLFQVILHGTHHLFGAYGLSLLFVLIYSAVFIILWEACPEPKESFATVFLFWLGLMACSTRYLARPEAFTYLMIALYTFVLLRFEQGRGPKWSVFLLIPLQALWTNLQGLFILGPFLIGAYAAQPVATVLIRKALKQEGSPDQYRKSALLIGVLAGSTIACLLNPYGLEGLLFPFTLFTRAGGMENIFALSIAELQPPFSGYNLTFPIKIFGVFLVLCAALLALDYRNLKLSHVLVLVGLGYLGLNARRNVALFVLAMLPIAVEHASGIVSQLRETRGGKFHKAIGTAELAGSMLISLIILFQIYSVITGRYYVADKRSERFGLGFKEQTFPHGAFSFLREKEIDGPFFNNMDIGGMFIWEMYPKEKVFIDPRLEVNSAGAFSEYRRAMSDPNAFAQLAGKYAFNAVIISHTSQDGPGLMRILCTTPRWALVYLDPIAAVFVRSSSRNAGLIEEHGIDIDRDTVAPIAPDDTLNDGGALPLGEILGGSPILSAETKAQNHFNLGLVFLMSGRLDRAISQLETGLELTPKSAVAHYNIGFAYEGMGRAEDAAGHYERAIAIDSRYVDAHSNLGRIFDERGLEDKAEREYKLAVKGGGNNPIPLFNLGAFYYERGDFKNARKYWEKALKANPSFVKAKQALELLK
jgi:tetratricopeptide (TPR) repeat protein